MSNYTHRTAPPNNQDIWDGVVFLIVLFNQSPDESLSYQTLQKALVKITANYQIILKIIGSSFAVMEKTQVCQSPTILPPNKH